MAAISEDIFQRGNVFPDYQRYRRFDIWMDFLNHFPRIPSRFRYFAVFYLISYPIRRIDSTDLLHFLRNSQKYSIGICFENSFSRGRHDHGWPPDPVWGLTKIGFVWVCFWLAPDFWNCHNYLFHLMLIPFGHLVNWVCFFKLPYAIRITHHSIRNRLALFSIFFLLSSVFRLLSSAISNLSCPRPWARAEWSLSKDWLCLGLFLTRIRLLKLQ